MSEKIGSFENQAERIPTEVEVWAKIEEMLAGREFTEILKKEDTDGVKHWAIQTTDEAGDQVDIDYKRKGVSETGIMAVSSIHETLYMGDTPVATGRQFEFINGNWKQIGS